MIALFDVDFVFPYPCLNSDIQQAQLKSTKNYEIVACVSGKHLALIILRKTGLFLSGVMIIFWMVCNIIPGAFFTITEGFFFECVRMVLGIRLENILDFTEEV